MYRTIEVLCLMVLDKSRVNYCHSRDIGYIYIPVYELLNLIWNEWKCETRRGMMMIYRYGSRTGFLGVLDPSVSIKDRSLSTVLRVGGSRNR